jgi:hypothetical protein
MLEDPKKSAIKKFDYIYTIAIAFILIFKLRKLFHLSKCYFAFEKI